MNLTLPISYLTEGVGKPLNDSNFRDCDIVIRHQPLQQTWALNTEIRDLCERQDLFLKPLGAHKTWQSDRVVWVLSIGKERRYSSTVCDFIYKPTF